jgi:hypothetical protein
MKIKTIFLPSINIIDILKHGNMKFLLFFIPSICLFIIHTGCTTKASINGTYEHSIVSDKKFDFSMGTQTYSGYTLGPIKHRMEQSNFIYPPTPMIITLNHLFLRYLQSIDGEILVYAETTSPERPDLFEPRKRIVAYKRGQGQKTDIGFIDPVIWGPLPAPEFPFNVRLIVAELDKNDNDELAGILKNAASAAAALKPEAVVPITIAEQIGSYLIHMNTDDLEFDVSYTFYPVSEQDDLTILPQSRVKGERKQNITLPMMEQKIVTVKTELLCRHIPPEDFQDAFANILTWQTWIFNPFTIGSRPPNSSTTNRSMDVTSLTYFDGQYLRYRFGGKEAADYSLWPPENIGIFNPIFLLPRLLVVPFWQNPLSFINKGPSALESKIAENEYCLSRINNEITKEKIELQISISEIEDQIKEKEIQLSKNKIEENKLNIDIEEKKMILEEKEIKYSSLYDEILILNERLNDIPSSPTNSSIDNLFENKKSEIKDNISNKDKEYIKLYKEHDEIEKEWYKLDKEYFVLKYKDKNLDKQLNELRQKRDDKKNQEIISSTKILRSEMELSDLYRERSKFGRSRCAYLNGDLFRTKTYAVLSVMKAPKFIPETDYKAIWDSSEKMIKQLRIDEGEYATMRNSILSSISEFLIGIGEIKQQSQESLKNADYFFLEPNEIDDKTTPQQIIVKARNAAKVFKQDHDRVSSATIDVKIDNAKKDLMVKEIKGKIRNDAVDFFTYRTGLPFTWDIIERFAKEADKKDSLTLSYDKETKKYILLNKKSL